MAQVREGIVREVVREYFENPEDINTGWIEREFDLQEGETPEMVEEAVVKFLSDLANLVASGKLTPTTIAQLTD